MFTKGHPERSASGLIGLGEWGGEESSPEQRTAFAFELWQDDLAFFNGEAWVTELGEFEVWVAPDATSGIQGAFRIGSSAK